MDGESFGIGRPALRKEDARLLAGRGAYGDDLDLPGQVYAQMVRSPHAHARIARIDVEAALAVPGVVAVLTGRDAAGDGLKPIPHLFRLPEHPPDVRLSYADGGAPRVTPHHPLPADKVRHVGEAVAMVLAGSIAAAKAGAEQVAVTYDVLPAVVASEAAAEPDAPLVWDDLGSNICLDGEIGDRAATDAAFARAAHVVKLKTAVQRVTGVPLEPRTALGVYDAASGRYVLHAGSSGAVRLKNEIAAVLGVAPDALRVVTGDVGGNFGTRNSIYPEFPLVLWAARRVGRPVKWTCERGEAFLSDYQGRDLVATAELALDKRGNFLALRGDLLSNIGAHTVSFVAIVKCAGMLSSVYRMPAAHVRARGVLTHSPPTHPLRSTGRPEAMLVIERLIELAAAHGFDPMALRRRNLVPAAAMPYANPFGLTYDSGDYAACMERALALADWRGFPRRRREAKRRGRCRGIGVANYIETCTGAARERAQLTVQPEGRVELVIGTQSSGQGHETSFAQLVVEWLGVPFDAVSLVMGDTDAVGFGGGSHSGRSMRMAGIVVGVACDAIVRKARLIAEHELEAAAADIERIGGRFVVRGTDRSIGLFELAAAAMRPGMPEHLVGPLAATADETRRIPAFPYGAHVCEVEVDPATGEIEIANYVAVDDVGRAINPLILHGQAHGGVAHGVGQALMERCHYELETGELLSGSFMDYTLPRASHFPPMVTEISEVPSPTNPLGIRAGGEGGTTPALAVMSNAVLSALAEFGVKQVELPLTPERVWRAIARAGAQ